MLFHDECNVCGKTVAAEDPTVYGIVLAVHLHDEHPEEFESRAEDARKMIEEAEEVVENSAGSPLNSIANSLFGGENA